MHLTYLSVKALQSGGERIIEGWATTGTPDLVNDIVVPEGCEFSLPLPLLFAHDHAAIIGAVLSATVTKAGIRIRAKLTEGVAKSEEVWRLIVDGAINAVSIGFKALESTPLPSGGLRFEKWRLLEISCVAVPCNPAARISIGKSMAYTDASIEAKTAGATGAAEVNAANFSKAFETAEQEVAQFPGITGVAKSQAIGTRAACNLAALNLASAMRRIDELSARVAKITQKGVTYRGVFNSSESYKHGDLVTCGGSIFHATRDTSGVSPAHGDERKQLDHPWQLACRRGRDAAQR